MPSSSLQPQAGPSTVKPFGSAVPPPPKITKRKRRQLDEILTPELLRRDELEDSPSKRARHFEGPPAELDLFPAIPNVAPPNLKEGHVRSTRKFLQYGKFITSKSADAKSPTFYREIKLATHRREANITSPSYFSGPPTKELTFEHISGDPDMYIDAGDVFVHVHRSVIGRELRFQPIQTFLHHVDSKPSKLDWYNGDPIWSHKKVSGRQWELVLDFIYNPTTASPDDVDIKDIAEYLCLSKYFSCPLLRDFAICALSRYCPSKLESYLHLPHTLTPSDQARRVIILRLCIEYEIDQLRPVAYYMCAQLPLRVLFHGIHTRGDFDCEVVDEPNYDRGHKLHRLEPGEIIRIMKGREFLSDCRRDQILGFLQHPTPDGFPGKPSPGCTSDEHPGRDAWYDNRCYNFLLTLWQALIDRDPTLGRKDGLPALKVLDVELREQMELGGVVCASCRETMWKSMRKAQGDVWRRIPEAFGMVSWFDVEERVGKTTAEMFPKVGGKIKGR